MKAGKTIQELAAEIDRQNKAKADYLVNTASVHMEPCGGTPLLRVLDDKGEDLVEPLDVRQTAHEQIGSYLNIPRKYYERMRTEDPELLAYNVNRWFGKQSEQRMLRTIDGHARAFLSRRYRRIDNFEVAATVLPVIGEMAGAQFVSSEITEDYLYLKVVNPRLTAEVVPGDVVQAGIVIRNSETGRGAVSVMPMIYRLVCSNGMTVPETGTRRNHVGRNIESDENFALYSEETLNQDAKAFLMKLEDSVRAAVEETKFAVVVDKMRQSTGIALDTRNIPSIVKMTGASVGYTESEGEGILQHLIEGKDFSLYGLANAVTRFSQDVEDYDRASKLEEIGYNVLTMSPELFRTVNHVTSLLYNNSINMMSWCHEVFRYERNDDGEQYLTSDSNDYYGCPIPAYKRGYSLFSRSHLPERTTVFGIGERTQDIYNSDELNDILAKTVITRTFEEVSGKDIRRMHQVPLRFSEEELDAYDIVCSEFYKVQRNYFGSTGNSRKDAMLRLMQQITLLLRVSAAPSTLKEYRGDTPVKVMAAVDMAAQWPDEPVVVGVRHKTVLDVYVEAFKEYLPDRPLFVVTGQTTTFAQRRKLRRTLRESGNGILLCTQQSLPSSVNFEFVNKVIIPELHYNNASMSQFYMRFVRYNSTEYKDIYFLTYAGSLESNLMQMVLVKEKINLFMKGQDTDLDEIYEKFGVDFDLFSLMMRREQDEKGKFHIRWGEQKIA